MIDRVTTVDPKGGSWGLGLVVAEKSLNPAAWYFNCHFKNDLCLPGTLVGEGCIQLLQFYTLHQGLQTRTLDARFQPVPGIEMAGYSRGQIKPTSDVLTYRLEVTDIGLSPEPFATANADVIFAGKIVARCQNLGVRLSEKSEGI
jgi:3-hydroxymyristoyl/3-hydroxydecanoyl-(acyl carrier protein) dehydratase